MYRRSEMNATSRHLWLDTLVMGALALAVGLSQLRVGLSTDDEGLLCDYSLRLLQGQTPYVEFIPPYALGRYALVAAAFALFGPSVVVMRGVFIAMLVISTLLTHRLALRLLPRALAIVPCASLLILCGPLWKVDIHLALASAALAACFCMDAPSRKRLALTGAVAGICGWDRPDVAVIACAMSLAAWIAAESTRGRSFFRDAATFTASAIVAYLPLVASLLIIPGAATGFLNAHLWMLKLSDRFSLPLPNPFAFPLGIINGLLHYAGLILAAITLAYVVAKKRRDAHAVTLVVLAVAATLIWNQVRIRANFGHALQAAWPVWLLMPALLALAFKRFAAVAVVTFALLFAWQGTLANATAISVIARWSGEGIRTHWPRADVYLQKELARDFALVLDELDRRKGSVLPLPYAPTFAFIAERRIPTVIDNFLPGRLDAQRVAEVIATLEAEKDPTILLTPFDGIMPEPYLAEHYPQLYSYIQANFVVYATPAGSSLLMRRSEREAAAAAPQWASSLRDAHGAHANRRSRHRGAAFALRQPRWWVSARRRASRARSLATSTPASVRQHCDRSQSTTQLVPAARDTKRVATL